jgi:RNA polymerase sigma-70 factor, ECF subfamily
MAGQLSPNSRGPIGSHYNPRNGILAPWHVHLNTFDGRAKFSTWLTRITINLALLILRRRNTRAETPMERIDDDWQQWEIPDRTKDVEQLYAQHERIEQLRVAIGRLRPVLRSVVEIYQSDQRSIKEVAEVACLSIAATKSRLLRARRIHRKSLEP